MFRTFCTFFCSVLSCLCQCTVPLKMRTISNVFYFSDAFTEQRQPHTSISTRSLFAVFAGSCARPRAKRSPKRAQTGLKPDALRVHLSQFSQGPARVREQSASLNAHTPDSNPTLFSQFSPRPAPVREQSACLNAHRPDSNPTSPPTAPARPTAPTRRPKTGVDDIIKQRYSIPSLFTRSFFAVFARFFARFFHVFACALGRLKCARFSTISHDSHFTPPHVDF